MREGTHSVEQRVNQDYHTTVDFLGANKYRQTAHSYNKDSSFGRSMYTCQGAAMRSYAPKIVQSRDKQWVNLHSMLKDG